MATQKKLKKKIEETNSQRFNHMLEMLQNMSIESKLH